MKRELVAAVVFIFLFMPQRVLPQVTKTSGNLLRINFLSPTINLSDTLWNWSKKVFKDSSYSSMCMAIVHWDSKAYLITETYDDSPHLPWVHVSMYDVTARKTYPLMSTHPPIDWDFYLYFQPEVRFTANGVWFFYGRAKLADFFSNDSLHQFEEVNGWRLIHAAGKIEGKELIVMENTPYVFKYYLEDFISSPKIDLTNEVIVEDISSQTSLRPFKVQHIRDSLYLYREDMGYLYLSSFGNNKLKLLKRLKPEEPSIWPFWVLWRFVNGNLFYLDGHSLMKEEFSFISNSLQNKKSVIDDYGNNCAFSDNGNTFAFLKHDSLFVYSVNEERMFSTYDIKSIPHINGIVIDSPYVYIHQTSLVTKVHKEKSLPTTFVLNQNYPNPFNPSTTIGYDLPTAGFVSLKIYDFLGREIKTLVNEYQQSGGYHKTFSTAEMNLSSGVYFCELRAGGLIQTKKMILMK